MKTIGAPRAAVSSLLLVTSVFWVSGCAGERHDVASAPIQPNSGLLSSIHDAFRQRNPRITRVFVFEICPTPHSDGSRYAVVARGVAPNPGSRIDFSNELFGVFRADSTLTRVERVLDIFPTPSWGDYVLQLQASHDTLYVIGTVATYDVQNMRRYYEWDAEEH